MKASGGPQKLRFTIHACSGEVSALERQHGEQVDQGCFQQPANSARRLLTGHGLSCSRTPLPQPADAWMAVAQVREHPGRGVCGTYTGCCPRALAGHPSHGKVVTEAPCHSGSANTLRRSSCAWSRRAKCSRFRFWRMSIRYMCRSRGGGGRGHAGPLPQDAQLQGFYSGSKPRGGCE